MAGNRRQVEKNGAMDVDVKRLGDRGIEVLVSGRLDAETVGELRPVLLDRQWPSPRVLLNLSGVNAIDSAGMALVMMARLELEAAGTRFVVQCSSAITMRVMVAAGMARFVDLAPRRIDALRSLGEEVRPDAMRKTFVPARKRGAKRAVAASGPRRRHSASA